MFRCPLLLYSVLKCILFSEGCFSARWLRPVMKYEDLFYCEAPLWIIVSQVRVCFFLIFLLNLWLVPVFVRWETNQFAKKRGTLQARRVSVGLTSSSRSSRPPNLQTLTCQSQTDLHGILIVSRAACGPIHHLSHTHKHHLPFCVCACVCDQSLRDFFFCFSLFFVLHGQDIVSKSSRKDFEEKITLIFLYFSSSKMQKECSSLPAIKATMTLFLYSNGAKKIYLYISLYEYIHAKVVGVRLLHLLLAIWNNTTTVRHPKLITRNPKVTWREEPTAESCGTCGFWNSRGRGENHTQAGLQACMRRSFTGHLQKKQSLPNIYSRSPPEPLDSLLLLNTL